jgi:hypothetical protein
MKPNELASFVHEIYAFECRDDEVMIPEVQECDETDNSNMAHT